MSAENIVEHNRKSGIDYTISLKDDEKCLQTLDKQSNNLFVENLKSKRDKSPNTCQNNIDIGNDSTDIMRINVDKKNESNHTNSNIQLDLNSNLNSKRQKTVCYDFKKGVCRRRFCRYPHVMNADQVVFCHDFQNNACFRSNCRFIHRSIEDEDHYRTYGVFPLPAERSTIVTNINQDHHIAAPLHPPPPPPPHLNYYSNCDNMMNQSQMNQQQSNQQASIPSFTPNPSMPLMARRRSFGVGDNNIEPIMPSKRPHIEEIRSPTVSTPAYQPTNNDNSHQCRFVEQNVGGAVNGAVPTSVPNSVAQVQTVSAQPVASVVITEDVINIYRLYEEHNLLRRRVEINEERLQELRATNQYLLQQNEQLRRQTQCSCTNTIVNPVTLTTASQQSATPQVLNAVSIAPVQVQATPIVSIASIAQPQTQIITSSTPLAIAANTSQGQQLALASTQQAGQILGTSQITLATAPSMGITMNTSQPLAMSANATQPIISYPVMTHSILPH